MGDMRPGYSGAKFFASLDWGFRGSALYSPGGAHRLGAKQLGSPRHSHGLGALLWVASPADGFGLRKGITEASVHHLEVQPPAAAILGELGP